MESLKTIRRKIKTVKNIQKITRAMKMVAAAKLRRVHERVVQSRPYSKKLLHLVRAVAPHAAGVEHPLLEVRPTRCRGLLVLTSDKGLCGGFNNNILRMVTRVVAQWDPTPTKIVAIGKKGFDFLARRGYTIARQVLQPAIGAPFAAFAEIADVVESWYRSGDVDEVHVAHAVFKSAMSQEPTIVRLLPIESPHPVGSGEGLTASTPYLFEPDAKQLLGHLLPRYLRFQIYHFLLEAMASEQGARVTSMTAATDNAGELLDSLTLAHNKARQWTITKELLDIVGGAEALKQVH